MRRNKFGEKKTVVDGIKFDSGRESRRYLELKMLQKAGEIQGLRLQVPYLIVVNEKKICKYVADFVYTDTNGNEIVEDSKGFRTPEYRLKAKLMLAVHGIEIYET